MLTPVLRALNPFRRSEAPRRWAEPVRPAPPEPRSWSEAPPPARPIPRVVHEVHISRSGAQTRVWSCAVVGESGVDEYELLREFELDPARIGRA